MEKNYTRNPKATGIQYPDIATLFIFFFIRGFNLSEIGHPDDPNV